MPDLDKSVRFRTAPASYLYATAFFGVALLVRLVLSQYLHTGPFLIFYTAVVVSYLLCGSGPGHWVTALSALAGTLLIIQGAVGEGLLYPAVFLVCCGVISWIARRAHTDSVRLREGFAQLHRAEELHRSTLEAQSDAVIRLRADGTVLYVNEAFCQLLRCVRSETVGRIWPPLALAQAEPFSAESLAALSPENPVVESDQCTVTADDEVRWVHFVNHGAYDDKGRLLEVHSVGRDITERKQLEERLALLSAEFEDLYEHSPAGHFSLDVSGKFIRANETTLRWLGCRQEDLIGKKNLTDFLSPQGRHLFRNLFPRLKHLGHCDERQFDLNSLDGTVRTVTMSSTTIRSADDNFLATRSVINDVTEVEQVKRRLARVAAENAAMLDNELVGIVRLQERRIVWFNRAAERLLGYSLAELIGQSTRMLYIDQATFDEVGRLAAVALEAGASCRTQAQMVRKDGTVLWVDLNGATMSSDTSEMVWLLADVTQSRLVHEEVVRLAHHDPLTGLPNRLLLRDRLAQARALSRREGCELAVCYLDLDGFKAINDLHGHEAGDELLLQVANRLQLAVRANDTVCRLGGDEFVLLLNQLTRPDEYLDILKRATSALCEPVVLKSGAVVQVSTSVGVAIFLRHSTRADELIRLADHAMYDAKKAGRNRIVTCQT